MPNQALKVSLTEQLKEHLAIIAAAIAIVTSLVGWGVTYGSMASRVAALEKQVEALSVPAKPDPAREQCADLSRQQADLIAEGKSAAAISDVMTDLGCHRAF